ncbi:DUF3099 domain-containing protein [uncultured Jatrophihabitans sp.]|uniref:DUF3099 domain-containing protein n=1 Tax=uncultured Jatrophihabitans sp. TaxID=1610747 RepID=UPI0035CA9B9A
MGSVLLRRSHSDEAALITTAHESGDEEFDRRRRKYAIMMSLRALAILGAALTYRFSLWLALAFILAGMVLPWCAVIIANDRAPKKRSPAPGHQGDLRGERALPSGHDPRTIDG